MHADTHIYIKQHYHFNQTNTVKPADAIQANGGACKATPAGTQLRLCQMPHESVKHLCLKISVISFRRVFCKAPL